MLIDSAVVAELYNYQAALFKPLNLGSWYDSYTAVLAVLTQFGLGFAN